MREIRQSGSEGGAAQTNGPSLPLSRTRIRIPVGAAFAARLRRAEHWFAPSDRDPVNVTA